MNDSPTTLRSLMDSLHAAFQEIPSLLEKSVLDWPIWLLLPACVAAILAFRLLLPVSIDVAVGTFRLIFAVASEIRILCRDVAGRVLGGRWRVPPDGLGADELEDFFERRGRFASDDGERLRWANREEEYSDQDSA